MITRKSWKIFTKRFGLTNNEHDIIISPNKQIICLCISLIIIIFYHYNKILKDTYKKM